MSVASDFRLAMPGRDGEVVTEHGFDFPPLILVDHARLVVDWSSDRSDLPKLLIWNRLAPHPDPRGWLL
jgi:hypothetical protein